MSKEREIPMQKRNQGIMVLQNALNIAGFGITYPQAVLIDRVNNLLAKKGDKSDLKDLTQMKYNWVREFLVFEEQNKTEE
jgi:hypothetical protein